MNQLSSAFQNKNTRYRAKNYARNYVMQMGKKRTRLLMIWQLKSYTNIKDSLIHGLITELTILIFYSVQKLNERR